MPIKEKGDNALSLDETRAFMKREAEKAQAIKALYSAGFVADRSEYQKYLTAEYQEYLAAKNKAMTESGPAPDEDPIVDLTRTEIDIILYALDMLSTKQLAKTFESSPGDMHQLLDQLYRKLVD